MICAIITIGLHTDGGFLPNKALLRLEKQGLAMQWKKFGKDSNETTVERVDLNNVLRCNGSSLFIMLRSVKQNGGKTTRNYSPIFGAASVPAGHSGQCIM